MAWSIEFSGKPLEIMIAIFNGVKTGNVEWEFLRCTLKWNYVLVKS